MNTKDDSKEKTPGLNLAEKGKRDGKPISLDRRLFMQFLALRGGVPVEEIVSFVSAQKAGHVLYEDLNDPAGIGLLLFSESPDDLLTIKRRWFFQPPFSDLDLKEEYTMLGRTYTLGHEENLEQTLITRPIQRVTDPGLPWAIWYPVRRAGDFETLSAKEQRKILMEHGGVGMAYGKAGYAHDIRLACHGLDKADNDFVIGILGPELYPLSHLVQRMRKTTQTSQYLANLGPFFVGKAVWQHAGGEGESK